MKQMVCAVIAATLWMVPQASFAGLKSIQELGINVRAERVKSKTPQELLNLRRNPIDLDADTNPPAEDANTLNLSSEIPPDSNNTK